MPKKKQSQPDQSQPDQTQQTAQQPAQPSTANKTRGPNSTTVVVSMKTAMRDALMLSAEFNLKSLSGQAAQYILEGLKRDGFLPAQAGTKPVQTPQAQPTQAQSPQVQPPQVQTPQTPF